MAVVRIVNLSHDLRGSERGRCQVVARKGRCPYDGRWGFTLDDERLVVTCRLHANAGERNGELHLVDAHATGARP